MQWPGRQIPHAFKTVFIEISDETGNRHNYAEEIPSFITFASQCEIGNEKQSEYDIKIKPMQLIQTIRFLSDLAVKAVKGELGKNG